MALFVTLKVGQAAQLTLPTGEVVRVVVCDTEPWRKEPKVRLGIDAPRHVPAWRGELLEQKREGEG